MGKLAQIALVFGLLAALTVPAAATSKSALQFQQDGSDLVARGAGYTLRFSATEVSINGVSLLLGEGGSVSGVDPLGGGRFSKVRYSGVFPGVELTFHGYDRQLNFDITVPGGVDPGRLLLRFSGARGATVDREGGLSVQTSAGSLFLAQPSGQQLIGGSLRSVGARFVSSGGTQVGVGLDLYDTRNPLALSSRIEYSELVATTGAANNEIAVGWAAASAPSALRETHATHGSAHPTNIRDGFEDSTFPGNDDSFTGPHPIGFPINFFGATYTNTYVSNNGYLTFTQGSGTYTPFPINTTQLPLIAPFFADVDTRAGNTTKYGPGTVNGRPAFGATYRNVGFYSVRTHRLNSFQVLLIDRSDTGPGNFDIEFNYDQIQWETGQASGGDANGLGGNSVRAGYSNGTTTQGTFFEIPGSAVNGALLDINRNTGLIHRCIGSTAAGRFFFPVRAGQPTQTNPSVCSGAGGGTFTPAGTNTPTSFTFNINITLAGGRSFSMQSRGNVFMRICNGPRGLFIAALRGRRTERVSVDCN